MNYEELTSKLSKNWKMNITLNDLLKDPKKEILFCIDNHTKPDEKMYNRYCLFVNTHSDNYIKVGIWEDGFVYNSNCKFDNIKNHYITIPMGAEKALRFLWHYRKKVLNIK